MAGHPGEKPGSLLADPYDLAGISAGITPARVTYEPALLEGKRDFAGSYAPAAARTGRYPQLKAGDRKYAELEEGECESGANGEFPEKLQALEQDRRAPGSVRAPRLSNPQ